MWQLIHWTGFVNLPPVTLWFSLVILEMTGKELSKGMNAFNIVNGLFSLVFVWLLWSGQLFNGIRVISNIGTTMVHTELTSLFWVYFSVNLIATVAVLRLALSRTRTQASHRRMKYLIFSLSGIIIGTFPLLLFGSGLLISQYPLIFWLLSVFGNAVVTVMVILLGYASATFSVSWSDRFTRLRMIEWMLRGPVTASLTLWLVTMINRSENALGLEISGANTFATVVSIILLEYLIGIIMPRIERSSLVGLGREDYTIYKEFQGMMVFKPELETYLEALTGALCDRFQARDGFFAVMDESGSFDPIIRTGESSWPDLQETIKDLPGLFQEQGIRYHQDNIGVIIPIFNHEEDLNTFLGLLGLADVSVDLNENRNGQVLEDALEKARTVLWQRRYLTSAYQVLRTKTGESGQNSFHSGSVLDQNALLGESSAAEPDEVTVWVKDALTHYWGGPRLSENPLLQWQIVQDAAAENNENAVNSLRNILKKALEELRPEGERSTNGEWTLYNLIDLKFFEKQKVKEIVRRLSMSEADFYRKQKVAVEALSKVIIRMENDHDK